jgi:hypothetical protein
LSSAMQASVEHRATNSLTGRRLTSSVGHARSCVRVLSVMALTRKRVTKKTTSNEFIGVFVSLVSASHGILPAA